MPEIADIFDVSRATVRFWLHRFNGLGPSGLYDEERSGRPRKITQEEKDTIEQIMRTSAEQAGSKPPPGQWQFGLGSCPAPPAETARRVEAGWVGAQRT